MDLLADDTIAIEVVCALPQHQQVIALAVAPGTTVRDAVRQSGVAGQFETVDIEACQLGVWGTVVGDACVVKAGDRVEIYRPLINDPREARMRLAADGQTMGPCAD